MSPLQLVVGSSVYLLRFLPNDPALYKVVIALMAFAWSFVFTFAAILIFRRVLPIEDSGPRQRNSMGIAYWAEPILLLLVFPLAWLCELLVDFVRNNQLPIAGDFNELLLLFPCLLVVALVHELGHVFAAKAVGLRARWIRIGPFILYRSCGGWRLRFDTKVNSFAGVPRSAPGAVGNLNSDLLFMLAAGPVVSLMFALVTIMALLSARGSNSGVLGHIFGACATLSFLLFAAGAWPTPIGSSVGDGPRIFTLFRGGADADRLCAFYACASSQVTDLRPRDWDEAWILALTGGGQSALDEFSGSLAAYTHALDAGRIEDAGARLERAGALAKQVQSPQIRKFLLESAYFEARHRDNGGQARRCFDDAIRLSFPIESHTILRCEAAVLLAEGRVQDADRALKEVKADLGRIERTGETLAESDLAQDLRTRLQSLPVPGTDPRPYADCPT